MTEKVRETPVPKTEGAPDPVDFDRSPAEVVAAEARLVTTGTKVLTQVARRGGVGAVVVELAHRLDGWGVLVDNHGQAIARAGAGALHIDDAVAAAQGRPTRVEHFGLQVHPIGEADDVRAFLVVASRSGKTSRTRDLASQAAALIDLLLRTHNHSATESLGREMLMLSLLSAPVIAPKVLLRRWGIWDDTLTSFVVSSRRNSVDLERLVLGWFDEMGTVHSVMVDKNRLVGLISDELVADLIARITGFVVKTQAQLRCGIGTSADLHDLARSVAEATEAHDAAALGEEATVQYAALPTVKFLLGAMKPESIEQVRGHLKSLMLEDGTPGDLIETLRVYIGVHGSWGVAAAQLKVHRHTVSTRIAQIEKLTGLSMADPDDRFMAWLALRALGYRASQ